MTPESDLNICVILQKNFLEIGYIFNEIGRFFEYLKTCKDFIQSANCEEKKSIYVIKTTLTEKFKNKKVEIIFKLAYFDTIVRNEYFVISYMNVYRWLKPLYLIFKRLLFALNMGNPLTGGINTFSIFLMIVAFLQKIESPVVKKASEASNAQEFNDTSFQSTFSNSTRTKEKFEMSVNLSANNTANNSSLGELFVNLIYFYAYSFDYNSCYLRPYVVDSPHNEAVFKVI